MFSQNNFYKQNLTLQKSLVISFFFFQQHFRFSARKFLIMRKFRPFSLKILLLRLLNGGICYSKTCHFQPLVAEH